MCACMCVRKSGERKKKKLPCTSGEEWEWLRDYRRTREPERGGGSVRVRGEEGGEETV